MTEQQSIHSMTGFGRAVGCCGGWDVSVEMRSVNHRYCDIRVRLPQELARHESDIRKQVQSLLERGRIELTVQLGKAGAVEAMPQFQEAVAARYIQLHQEASSLLGQASQALSAEQLLLLPGVLVMGQDQLPEEGLPEVVLQTTLEATRHLCEMRAQEGAELVAHLRALLDDFGSSIKVIEARAPAMPGLQLQRLQERLAQFSLEQEFEPARLAQEIAIFADRCDVSEELARLHSHLQQFAGALTTGGAQGRRLDFLCQELLRETNTIGSKNVDASIGTELIAMKSTIEKIREQVQNME